MIICLVPIIGVSSALFLTKMGNVLSKDAEYSDYHLDLSLNEKGLLGLLLRLIIPLAPIYP